MPLAKIVYDAFYRTNTGPEAVATFLAQQGNVARDAAGVALKPGRPIANPGPNRLVGVGATQLSGADSLFTQTYAWTLASGGTGATLTNTASVTPTFARPIRAVNNEPRPPRAEPLNVAVRLVATICGGVNTMAATNDATQIRHTRFHHRRVPRVSE